MNDEESPIIRRGPDNQPWYVVATALGEAEAAIISGLLESADIPVWVYQESAGRAIGLQIGLLGTVEILTPEAYYDEACDLLEADDDDSMLEDGADDFPDEGDFTVDGETSAVDE